MSHSIYNLCLLLLASLVAFIVARPHNPVLSKRVWGHGSDDDDEDVQVDFSDWKPTWPLPFSSPSQRPPLPRHHLTESDGSYRPQPRPPPPQRLNLNAAAPGHYNSRTWSKGTEYNAIGNSWFKKWYEDLVDAVDIVSERPSDMYVQRSIHREEPNAFEYALPTPPKPGERPVTGAIEDYDRVRIEVYAERGTPAVWMFRLIINKMSYDNVTGVPREPRDVWALYENRPWRGESLFQIYGAATSKVPSGAGVARLKVNVQSRRRGQSRWETATDPPILPKSPRGLQK